MHIHENWKTIKQGLHLIWTNETVTGLRQLVSTILKGIVWLIGKIDAYGVLSALFILQGTVNLYALLILPERRGGLSALATDPHVQLGIAIGMIIAGWLVANFRRLEILSLGSLFWVYYALRLMYATLFLSLSIGAFLSALNLLAAVAGVLSATHSKIQRLQDRAEYKQALADVRTLKFLKRKEDDGRLRPHQDTG